MTETDHTADEEPDGATESQILRCVACGHVSPALDHAEELIPASGVSGGRCAECGGGEFEQVVLDLDGD
jgi:DNA gyrase inhibitor GyrI